MKNKVALITIPHSGTRHARDVTLAPFTAAGGDLVTGHAFIDPVDTEGRIVVSVIRHPARIYKSWDRRGRFQRKQDEGRWEKIWAHMMGLQGVHYIHIDEPSLRDKEVTLLSDVLGCPLSLDWTPPAYARTHDMAIEGTSHIDESIMEFYRSTLNAQ